MSTIDSTPHFAQAEAATEAHLPRFVKDEFDAFLECGILAHGFLRLRCGDCGHDKLVAFSCKRRGFCPACGARRMAQTAAHLVDHVIPAVPVRQWVLSLPIPLRLVLAAQPQWLTPVLRVVHRVIRRHLLGQAGLKADEADAGAVTLIQRFGSAANLNIHLHCLVLDGVYRRRTEGAPEFVPVPAPSDAALQAVLHTIIVRTMKLLTRQGALIEEQGQTWLADIDGESDEARSLKALQAAACTYRIALGGTRPGNPSCRHCREGSQSRRWSDAIQSGTSKVEVASTAAASTVVALDCQFQGSISSRSRMRAVGRRPRISVK